MTFLNSAQKLAEKMKLLKAYGAHVKGQYTKSV